MAISQINAASLGSSQLADANMAPGSVIQVVSTTSSTSFSTTSSASTSTGISVSITPTSSTSKVFVIVNGFDIDTVASGRQVFTTIFRNSTNLGQGANEALADYYNANGRNIGPIAMCYLDSPATTSSTTYTIYMKCPQASTVTLNSQSLSGTITAMEIAG